MSLLTIAIELAKKFPQTWANRFDTEAQANSELDALELQRRKLTGAVGLSLDAAKQRLQQRGDEDRWLNISAADYLFLTNNRPNKVAFGYKSALQKAPDLL